MKQVETSEENETDIQSSAKALAEMVKRFQEAQVSEGALKLAFAQHATLLIGEHQRLYKDAYTKFLAEGTPATLQRAVDLAWMIRLDDEKRRIIPREVLAVQTTRRGDGKIRLSLWKFHFNGDAEYATHFMDLDEGAPRLGTFFVGPGAAEAARKELAERVEW